MRCSKCKKPLSPDDSFCPRCGHNNENYVRIKPKEISKGEVKLNPKVDNREKVHITDLPKLSDIKINSISEISIDRVEISKEQKLEVKNKEVKEAKPQSPKYEEVKKETYSSYKPNYKNEDYSNRYQESVKSSSNNSSTFSYNNQKYSTSNQYKSTQNTNTNKNKEEIPEYQNYEIGSYLLAGIAFVFFFIFPIFSIILSAIGISLAHYINNDKAKIVNIIALIISFIATIIFLASL